MTLHHNLPNGHVFHFSDLLARTFYYLPFNRLASETGINQGRFKMQLCKNSSKQNYSIKPDRNLLAVRGFHFSVLPARPTSLIM